MRWARVAGAVALLLLAVACARGPEAVPQATFRLADGDDTTLGRAVDGLAAAHPGQSGIHLLGNPRRAMATLLGLAEAAERSLDIQTYAWHSDTTGWLLIDAVRAAADRGVRVRILLDDLNSAGKDWVIAALDAHPAIEVRLFNPFRYRYLRFIDALSRFIASNRRMHNKSFTADNQASVLGGRNIGDSYLGEGARVTFADLDVLALGPVVEEVSAQFDLFWNSRFSVPADRIIRPHAPPPDDYLETRAAARRADAATTTYLEGLDGWRQTAPLAMLPLHWGRARLIFDPPEKIAVGRFAAPDTMIPALMATMGVPETRLDIVTPYFVISSAWSDVFVSWARRGVALRILTNSLAANDPGIAHAGYLVRRRALLHGGIELFELKADATDPHLGDEVRGLGGSAATLHAKAAAIDGRRLFVGSLNLDQRSAYLNTEMGIVIDNPELAEALHRMFDERLDEHAYRVSIAEDGGLAWHERTDEGEIVHRREPEAGVLRLLGAGLVVLLPIDWLL
jgi:putative cardiolipin synthase